MNKETEIKLDNLIHDIKVKREKEFINNTILLTEEQINDALKYFDKDFINMTKNLYTKEIIMIAVNRFSIYLNKYTEIQFQYTSDIIKKAIVESKVFNNEIVDNVHSTMMSILEDDSHIGTPEYWFEDSVINLL